jgi:hypothetical protein
MNNDTNKAHNSLRKIFYNVQSHQTILTSSTAHTTNDFGTTSTAIIWQVPIPIDLPYRWIRWSFVLLFVERL